MWRLSLLVVTFVALVGALVGQAGSASPASQAGAFTYKGTVIKVVDGDTVDVRLQSGEKQRVRVIGIDTPERGACYYREASARMSKLALRKNVTLRGDRTQDTRDRYGRLLAYVHVNGKVDVGLRLVRDGLAAVYVFRRPFLRLRAYERAAASAKSAKRGTWSACGVGAPAPPPPPTTTTAPPPPTTTSAPPPPPPPSGGCHPSYPTVCIPPPPPDLDCKDIPHRRFTVLPPDPHRFDGRDKDGIGCES